MNNPLPATLYTSQQVRELDAHAIDECGIPGIVLMKRAGRAALDALLSRWPAPERITVFCGAGNNGGDGYVVAALARQQGLVVEVVAVADPARLAGDARRAMEYARQEGVTIHPAGSDVAPATGVIVDAILGTGIRGEVRADAAAMIDVVNGSGLPVLAVDIPSGLCSDTGAALGACVRADMTVSFIGLKRGLFTAHGPAACGEVRCDELAVPAAIYERVGAGVQCLDWRRLRGLLPSRRADAHKGNFGHTMIIGGDHGFGGAAMLAAEAALRTGSGLVSVATRPEHVSAVLARTPEVMAIGVASGQELEPWLARPSVLVIGPGLGHSPWSEQLLQQAVATGLPMVVDADALNILAEGRLGNDADRSRWLLTPHPGEAGRLLGISSAQVQADRFAALAALRQQFGCAVLLKGAGTLVDGGEGVALCPYGNPGMATGGMGDVLSGVLGALLAQGLSPTEAVALGACLHGLAGDDAAREYGQAGLAAGDLAQFLRRRLNQPG